MNQYLKVQSSCPTELSSTSHTSSKMPILDLDHITKHLILPDSVDLNLLLSRCLLGIQLEVASKYLLSTQLAGILTQILWLLSRDCVSSLCKARGVH